MVVGSLPLTCINDGGDPTFIGRGRGLVVDVTFVSEGTVRRVVEWQVLFTDFASDHCGISFQMEWGNVDQEEIQTIWGPMKHRCKGKWKHELLDLSRTHWTSWRYS